VTVRLPSPPPKENGAIVEQLNANNVVNKAPSLRIQALPRHRSVIRRCGAQT
jgi:hypothetical protein